MEYYEFSDSEGTLDASMGSGPDIVFRLLTEASERPGSVMLSAMWTSRNRGYETETILRGREAIREFIGASGRDYFYKGGLLAFTAGPEALSALKDSSWYGDEESGSSSFSSWEQKVGLPFPPELHGFVLAGKSCVIALHDASLVFFLSV